MGMNMRKISCNPDVILEHINDLYQRNILPDLDIFCQDGVFKSYKTLFVACSGLVKECLSSDANESCIILPNISIWELRVFHATLLKLRSSPQNEELDAVLKVLTTLGVDIGQYLAVNLGPAAGNDAASSNLDIQCLHLISEHTKIENIEEEDERSIIVLPESLEIIPVQSRSQQHTLSIISQKSHEDKGSKLTELACPLCSHVFKNLATYEKHLASHQSIQQDNIQAENENEAIVQKDLKTEEERENIEPKSAQQQIILYQCSKCSQTFSSTKKLNAHFKTHEPREYSCEICLKSFKLKSTLTNHIKFHDDKERARRFTCDICMSNFSHPSNLKRHIKSVHGEDSEKRTLACYICSKLFKDNCTLKSHIENHNSTRRFPCEFCSKSYTRKSQLEAHYRVHTGEKPFECNICGKRFRLNGHLKSHKLSRHVGMKLEKSNLCPECGQGFIKEYDLRIHLRRHRGERPFTCHLCNKSFIGERNFRDHNRIHTGERPYECETCQKSFSSSSGIRQHFKASQNCRINASEGAYSKYKQKRTEWQRLEGLSLSELITTEANLNLNEYNVEQTQDGGQELEEGGQQTQQQQQETIVYLTSPELALVAGTTTLVTGATMVETDISGQVSIQAMPLQIDTEGNEVVLSEFLP